MRVTLPGNFRLISSALALVILGLLAPLLIGVKDMNILALMEASIVNNNPGMLLAASLRLVMLNTIRALPLYLGVLLIAEVLGLFRNRSSGWLILLPTLLIPMAYELIHLIYGITYDFGTPAIALILGIIIMNKWKDLSRHVLHKALIFTLLLFGVQWLDIVPGLKGFWFGRGEISTEIKLIAAFLNAEDVLNITGFALFATFVANSFITARLLNVYTREIKAVEQARRLERLAAELNLRSLENRSLREMQSLVHDLKTPLTTIQGLAGVIVMTGETPSVKEHAAYISETSDKMNNMISEFLKDDSMHIISVNELVEYTVAHMPQLHKIDRFHLILPEQGPLVQLNKIRMSRALTNIIENAMDAIDPVTGLISISIMAEDRQAVIRIADNGSGIAPDDRERIWQVGFSTKASSGIGLAFAREVIEKNAGTIHIASSPGTGTIVTITLPEVHAIDSETDRHPGY